MDSIIRAAAELDDSGQKWRQPVSYNLIVGERDEAYEKRQQEQRAASFRQIHDSRLIP